MDFLLSALNGGIKTVSVALVVLGALDIHTKFTPGGVFLVLAGFIGYVLYEMVPSKNP